jgi:predicted nucleic acid-binding protein
MNNSSVCVDANLIVRLLLDPTDEAVDQLWERWESEHWQPVAPTLLRYEVTNAFHRYDQAGLMDPAAVRAAMEALIELPIRLFGDAVLHQQALDMAKRFALPAAYDAHYLALAERLGAEFWTADRRLANVVRPTLPWVYLLGEAADIGQ